MAKREFPPNHDYILEPEPGSALLIIDVQADFLPGGTLAVSHGDRVLGPLNHAIDIFRSRGLPIFATRDWHPPTHRSFKQQGGPWPPHCVAGTEGAMFPKALHLPRETIIIDKGTAPDDETYSVFERTTLNDHLKRLRVKNVYIGGLATDYCVLNSVRDALALGYETYLLEDAVGAVNVRPDDGREALQEMGERGAISIVAQELR